MNFLLLMTSSFHPGKEPVLNSSDERLRFKKKSSYRQAIGSSKALTSPSEAFLRVSGLLSESSSNTTYLGVSLAIS
jgi:hypothetical protein